MDERVTLAPNVENALRAALPKVAQHTVDAIISEVPSYSEPFRGRMGRTIESAVALALRGFLDTATQSGDGSSRPLETVYTAAYELGRGEARNGRSMDALAAAYRVGASRAWRVLSRVAVDNDLPAVDLARFAGLVFDYIDELSAVSVSGHADELARRGRLRERNLAELATALLAGRTVDVLEQLADQAGWPPPRTLTAIVLPRSSAPGVRGRLDARTLEVGEDVTALDESAVLLVPDAGRRRRSTLLRRLGTTDAVVGPAVPWTQAAESFRRAARARELELGIEGPLDTDERLADLVVRADPVAHADLRERVLEPLAALKPAAREKLAATLRAWLLHQGRRDDMAQALFVHPQTVRYRMGQLREAYGEKLQEPQFVLEATIALV